jgi:dihydrofolate synthase/folylpolyglutamate synthase
MEMVSRNPRILLDGAHNPEGAEKLAETLQRTYSYDGLHVMMGMVENKNHEDTFKHILPIVDTLILTEPDYRLKMDVEGLVRIVEKLQSSRPDGKPFQMLVEKDWKTALHKLQQLTGERDLGVVTGTLYLIADVRSRILYNSDSEKGW